MITKEMIKKAYKDGIVKLKDSPHDDGVVCGIGDYWFYFGGSEAEGSTIEEYVKNVPMEDITDEILSALDGIRENLMQEEYEYYEAVLREAGYGFMPFLMVVTSEDDRYRNKEKGFLQLGHWADCPWDGLFVDAFFLGCGDYFDSVYAEHEGLFYQLYSTITGRRISAGVIDDAVQEEMEEYSAYVKEAGLRPARWYGEKPKCGKYVALVTHPGDKPKCRPADTTKAEESPWDLLFEDICYGDSAEKLYNGGNGCDTEKYYQLFSTETGNRLGYGKYCPEAIRCDIQKYEEAEKRGGLND